MQIFILSIQGTTIVLNVFNRITFKKLKLLCSERLSEPYNDKLIYSYGSKLLSTMKDSSTLKELSIVNLKTICILQEYMGKVGIHQ